MPGAHEHQHPAGAGGQLGRDRELVDGGHLDEAMIHPRNATDSRPDRVVHGIGEVAAHQELDGAVERGREQQPLPARRDAIK